jgi:hypothetical protein
MTIVQPADPTTGLFQITLPEQATDEQRALKNKIDALLETLKQRQSDANIGLLLGVSEQALPTALTRRASQFVSEIGDRS